MSVESNEIPLYLVQQFSEPTWHFHKFYPHFLPNVLRCSICVLWFPICTGLPALELCEIHYVCLYFSVMLFFAIWMFFRNKIDWLNSVLLHNSFVHDILDQQYFQLFWIFCFYSSDIIHQRVLKNNDCNTAILSYTYIQNIRILHKHYKQIYNSLFWVLS